jgi:hypothetical protein
MIKHLKTKKHENSNGFQKVSKSITNDKLYECECGKSYKYRQGLSQHRKKCCNNEISNLKDEILDLKNHILTLTKGGIFFDNSINITKSQLNFNNKNEIKIFLSEHCANALSIQDFVKQLTISLDDLMNTKVNTVNGITNIIERNLKPLTLTNRPVHHVNKHDWFIKNKEEWNEDDGNTLVDKTHKKIQKEYLKKTENELLNDDDYLLFVKNGTGELDNKEKETIKNELLKHCEISN